MALHSVAQLADLPPGSALQVVVDGRQIGIFNCGGAIYAADNVCTHAYAELHEGYIDSDDCSIECPLHGARFDLASGRVLSLPASVPLQVYRVSVEDETILVEL